MLAFKKFSFTTLLLAGLLTLSACDLSSPKGQRPDLDDEGEMTIQGDKDKPSLGSATFTVEFSPGKSSMLEARTVGAFQFPTSKVYNLTACLKDVAYNKTIQGHKFRIKELDQETRTDSAGCLTWKEEVKYNYLGDSKYIRIDRHIVGTGLHKGSRRVSFAINPWSHGENLPAILEIKANSDIPQLVESAEAVQTALKGRARSLWVEEGRLFMTEQRLTSKGVDLNAEFRANPSVILTKMNGELYQRPLTAGNFKARLKLIHVYMSQGKEIRRLLGQSQFESISMSNASLAIKHTISLSAIPTRGQVYLGLELAPVDGPEGLSSFDGIYMMGEYDTIKGTLILKVSTLVAQTKGFKIDNYINTQGPAVAQDPINPSPENDAYQKPKVEFDWVRFISYRMGPVTTTTRSINIDIQACMKNGIDQKVVRAHTFKITKFRQNEGDTAEVDNSAVTNNTACLSWTETLKFNAAECHHYIKGFVTIENADLGVNERLEIALNPWEQNDLVRDLRRPEQRSNLVFDCKGDDGRMDSMINIDSYSYSMQSMDYSVDNYLGLTAYKKVTFRIQPTVLNYSSAGNDREALTKLRDGVYLLKAAVVKNIDYDKNMTLVTYDQRLVNSKGGIITADMTFPVKDFVELGNRNNMIIELFPVDEAKIDAKALPQKLKVDEADALIRKDSNLTTEPFIGPVTLNMDETNRNVNLLDSAKMTKFFVTGKTEKSATISFVSQLVKNNKSRKDAIKAATAARYGIPVYAKENNLDIVNLSQLNDAAPMEAQYGKSDVVQRLVLTKADLQEIISTGNVQPATAQKLCNFWAKDYFSKMYADKGGALMQDMTMHFAMECYTAVKRDPSRFFQTEKRITVKSIASQKSVAGMNQAVTLGTGFSVATNHSTYSTTSKSWATKFGLGYKFLDLFSLGSDYTYQFSWSKSDGNQAANSGSLNSNKTLTVQETIFDLNVNAWEQCAVVRLNPRLFMTATTKNYVGILNPQLSEQEAVTVATRGLYLCEGQVRNEPIQLRESYYFLWQEQSSGQTQDVGDPRNRKLTIALRSINDFNRFLVALKGKLEMPTNATVDMSQEQDTSRILLKLFEMPGSSYPGMYLVK